MKFRFITSILGKLHAGLNKTSPPQRTMPAIALRGPGRGAAPPVCSAILSCAVALDDDLRWLTRWRPPTRRAWPESFQLFRQRDAVDQDHGVDLEPARILVRRASLIAVLSDEVVVVGDEQKVIVRIGRIERRHQRHSFPLFREIVAVVRLAVVQSELLQFPPSR